MPETEVGRRINDESSGFRRIRAGRCGRTRCTKPGWIMDMERRRSGRKGQGYLLREGASCKVLKVEEWPLYRAPFLRRVRFPLLASGCGACALRTWCPDVQDLRTEMTRQYLDNLALANQGELVVNEGRPAMWNTTAFWRAVSGRCIGSGGMPPLRRCPWPRLRRRPFRGFR